jgi:broad specificity phosphatase PhoE
VEEALGLREMLAHESIGLGVATPLLRTQETLELALGGRDVERIVSRGLGEIDFGSFEGGSLAVYREWAWTNAPDTPCPGGGESRIEAAARFAAGLDTLLQRPEEVVLAVSHALLIRHVLEASQGRFPPARIGHVPHATPHPLDADAVALAAHTLRAWASAPRFADLPG